MEQTSGEKGCREVNEREGNKREEKMDRLDAHNTPSLPCGCYIELWTHLSLMMIESIEEIGNENETSEITREMNKHDINKTHTLLSLFSSICVILLCISFSFFLPSPAICLKDGHTHLCNRKQEEMRENLLCIVSWYWIIAYLSSFFRLTSRSVMYHKSSLYRCMYSTGNRKTGRIEKNASLSSLTFIFVFSCLHCLRNGLVEFRSSGLFWTSSSLSQGSRGRNEEGGRIQFHSTYTIKTCISRQNR